MTPPRLLTSPLPTPPASDHHHLISLRSALPLDSSRDRPLCVSSGASSALRRQRDLKTTNRYGLRVRLTRYSDFFRGSLYFSWCRNFFMFRSFIPRWAWTCKVASLTFFWCRFLWKFRRLRETSALRLGLREIALLSFDADFFKFRIFRTRWARTCKKALLLWM